MEARKKTDQESQGQNQSDKNHPEEIGIVQDESDEDHDNSDHGHDCRNDCPCLGVVFWHILFLLYIFTSTSGDTGKSRSKRTFHSGAATISLHRAQKADRASGRFLLLSGLRRFPEISRMGYTQAGLPV